MPRSTEANSKRNPRDNGGVRGTAAADGKAIGIRTFIVKDNDEFFYRVYRGRTLVIASRAYDTRSEAAEGLAQLMPILTELVEVYKERGMLVTTSPEFLSYTLEKGGWNPEEYIALRWQYDNLPEFDVKLLELIALADDSQRTMLRKAYPQHVVAYLLWTRGNLKEKFATAELEWEASQPPLVP